MSLGGSGQNRQFKSSILASKPRAHVGLNIGSARSPGRSLSASNVEVVGPEEATIEFSPSSDRRKTRSSNERDDTRIVRGFSYSESPRNGEITDSSTASFDSPKQSEEEEEDMSDYCYENSAKEEQPNNAENSEYPFWDLDCDANILFEPQVGEQQIQKVKAGSIVKLVERLTYEKYPDPPYLLAFLLTYRSFTTPHELLGLLKDRFNIPFPKNLPESEYENYKKEKIIPVRLRIFNVCKTWVSTHTYDFEDKDLVENFLDFVRNTMKTTMPRAADQLELVLQRKTEGSEQQSTEAATSKPKPKPLIPSNPNPKLEDINTEEIARQLALRDFALFKAIKPWECLNQNWTKKTQPPKAPNILAMINHFNNISNWARSEISKVESHRARTATLARFIEIAEKCKNLNNFSSCMAILAALQSSPIFRLKPNWADLPKKSNNNYEDLIQLTSSDKSYHNMRVYLKTVTPPVVPYFGMYLTDLTFIEDGNPDKINGLINFAKCRQISTVIRYIQQFQLQGYAFEPISVIIDLILNAPVLSEDECYKLSLFYLPRGGGSSITPIERQKSTGKLNDKKKERDKDKEKEKDREGARLSALKEEFVDDEDFGELEYPEGYPFAEKDSESNLLLSDEKDEAGKHEVLGGTLAKLVERLTFNKYPDPHFLDVFLLTYQSFTTSLQLLKLLIQRFNVPKPKNATKEKLERYQAHRVLPVQLRVFNVLKNWTEKQITDFIDNAALVAGFTEFLGSCIGEANSMKKAAHRIQQSVEKQLSLASGPEGRKFRKMGCSPALILPSLSSDKWTLLCLHPEELARQITLEDQRVFRLITPVELLQKDFSHNNCPALNQFITRTTKIQNWVYTEVMKSKDAIRRAGILTHFIKIAQAAFYLRNYNCLVAIMGAIASNTIKNLYQTWKFVPTKLKEAHDDLMVEYSNHISFDSKNDTGSKAEARFEVPCVPYLGFFLTSLIRIQATNEDFLTVNGVSLINFVKRRKLASYISELVHYQRTSFALEVSEDIQNFLNRVELWDSKKLDEIAHSLHQEEEPQRKTLTLLSGSEDTERIKNSLKSILFDDVNFKKQMYPILSETLRTAKTQQDVQRLHNQVRHLLEDYQRQLISVCWNNELNLPRPVKAFKELIKAIGWTSLPPPWEEFDQKGVVYGWPDQIKLFVLERSPETNMTYVIDIYRSAHKSILALFLRKIAFFKETNSKPLKLKYFLITSQISPAAKQIAERNEINVWYASKIPSTFR